MRQAGLSADLCLLFAAVTAAAAAAAGGGGGGGGGEALPEPVRVHERDLFAELLPEGLLEDEEFLLNLRAEAAHGHERRLLEREAAAAVARGAVPAHVAWLLLRHHEWEHEVSGALDEQWEPPPRETVLREMQEAVVEKRERDARKARGERVEPLEGHLRRMGEQGAPESPVREWAEGAALPGAAQFWDEHVRTGQPALFRGLGRRSALHGATAEEVMRRAGDASVITETLVENRTDAAERYDSMPLREWHEGHSESLYVVSVAPQPLLELEAPPFLQCAKRLPSQVMDAPPGPRWMSPWLESGLWVSRRPSRSQLHYDQVNIWNCLLSGPPKEWLFYDTRRWSHLLPSVMNAFSARRPNSAYRSDYSRVDPAAVDLERFPWFRRVPLRRVTQRAGDCLFVPARHFHQVTKPETGFSFGLVMMMPQLPHDAEACREMPPGTWVPLRLHDVYLRYTGRGNNPIGMSYPVPPCAQLWQDAVMRDDTTARPVLPGLPRDEQPRVRFDGHRFWRAANLSVPPAALADASCGAPDGACSDVFRDSYHLWPHLPTFSLFEEPVDEADPDNEAYLARLHEFWEREAPERLDFLRLLTRRTRERYPHLPRLAVAVSVLAELDYDDCRALAFATDYGHAERRLVFEHETPAEHAARLAELREFLEAPRQRQRARDGEL